MCRVQNIVHMHVIRHLYPQTALIRLRLTLRVAARLILEIAAPRPAGRQRSRLTMFPRGPRPYLHVHAYHPHMPDSVPVRASVPTTTLPRPHASYSVTVPRLYDM